MWWRLCLLALIACLSTRVSGQSGKSELPRCPSNETVCNAVLHFPDRVVDQGCYCNGCANCSLLNDADSLAAADALADSSFYWQHWEDPKLLVQFIKCSPMPQRAVCGAQQQQQDRGKPAAVFVSPRSNWSPSLQRLNCVCQPPLYQLRSWRPDDTNWYYEFSCQMPACGVPEPAAEGGSGGGTGGGGGDDHDAGSVCAVKRRAGEDSPSSVEFKCACPGEYHCVIKDVETKRSAADQSHEGKESSDDWQPDVGEGGDGGGGGGGQISRRRCQKRHSSNVTTTVQL